MQLAYELEESMTIIHFKIPKVNCTEVMLVLMQVSFYCSGFVRITSLIVLPMKHTVNCPLLVHCILNVHAEFLNRNAILP
jgi:hypothetical protein